MAYVAWRSDGREGVLRDAAPDWPSGQAAQRRMAAIGKPPEGPAARTHAAASSLRCVSAYAPSLFLAAHARAVGATYAIGVNRP